MFSFLIATLLTGCEPELMVNREGCEYEVCSAQFLSCDLAPHIVMDTGNLVFDCKIRYEKEAKQ